MGLTSTARGDVTKRKVNMRVGREIYGGDLHAQAGTVEVVSFKVADVDVLGREIACDDVCSAVRDTAVFCSELMFPVRLSPSWIWCRSLY